jgi:hypothetical protein
MKGEKFKGLRIAIVGSCQVAGLAAAAHHFLPGAEVSAWHVGVNPQDSDEEILARIAGFDLVISQMPDTDEHVLLRTERLRQKGIPVLYLPVLVFSGFHPDITYIRSSDGPLVPGLMMDYHSLIVVAAFTLGLPEHRILTLFNQFVFTELGYFEVFDASKTALLQNFQGAGYELTPLFDEWLRREGRFMYTVNHPHIFALATLCRLALARAGLIDAMTPVPENIEDSLATHFNWPIYPALSRRIGLPGSTTFLHNVRAVDEGQSRELSLAEFIAASFRIYQSVGTESLRTGVVAKACERLGAFVVA